MNCFNKEWNYVSLDIEEKYKPDICISILDFDYKKYFEKNGLPVFVWFSPPCNEYSSLNYAMPNKIPDIEGSNNIVRKGLEIIEYIGCKFVIENPQTGTLKKQGILDNIKYTDVDYCQYGFPYRKRTRLWNNIGLKGHLCNKKTCQYVLNGRHEYSIGNSSYKTNVKKVGIKKSRLEQRYSVPDKLLLSISELLLKK
tara:strand:- start:2222 stop:2812 length:591 start_codon:yes stop_codon:yes gene_type:complete